MLLVAQVPHGTAAAGASQGKVGTKTPERKSLIPTQHRVDLASAAVGEKDKEMRRS